MKRRLQAIAAACALTAAAACGGHGTLTPTGPTASAFDWGQAQLRGAVLLGPAHLDHMQVTALVHQQNASGLVTYALQASTPGSPLYRQFLTPQQIGDRFGATERDYQQVASYFVAHGLSVAGWPQHIGLSVAGSQAAMEDAFHTKFGLYSKDGFTFVAPVGTPRFGSSLAVDAVENLVALHAEHNDLALPPRANASTTLGYSPQQVRNAFDYTGAYAKGFTGTGMTIGIIATGPINISRSSLCPATDKDLQALSALYNNINVAKVCEVDVTANSVAAGLAVSNIPTAPPASPNPSASPIPAPGQSPTSMFPFSGSFQTPPPITGNCSGSLPACNPEDGEAQLDVQQTATLAPGATVNVYLGYNANDCYVYFPNSCATPPPGTHSGNYGAPQLGIVESDPEIEQAIADNAADVISISYGLGEPQGVDKVYNASGIGYEPEEFAALAAEGVAVFAASGDSGSAECLNGTGGYLAELCVNYPSGDVNVTSVGGVNAPLDEFGQITGNITAWGVSNGGNGAASGSWSGSGGGTSTIFAAPSWQHSAVGATMREQPDASLLADPLTSITLFTNSGLAGSPRFPSGPRGIGGTSVAAPQMAAMWALVLQACNATPACRTGPAAHPYRLGNAAPLLYGIYNTAYASVFYDVLYGSNAMCPVTAKPGVCGTPIPGQNAATGYDEATGLGVPFAGHLIHAITGQTVP